jgi:hypothetical protein
MFTQGRILLYRISCFQNLAIILLLILFLQGCNSSQSEDLLRNQTGTLLWARSPELDGLGVLFETTDTTYGIPGDKNDYSGYFPGSKDEVRIKADVRLTGETTVRGWGLSYPEAMLTRIRVQ